MSGTSSFRTVGASVHAGDAGTRQRNPVAGEKMIV
jgi:hypothetical protein